MKKLILCAFVAVGAAGAMSVMADADTDTGVYTTTGTPADLAKAIAKLVFQPQTIASGQTQTTRFTLSVSNGALINPGELILIDSERMQVEYVVGKYLPEHPTILPRTSGPYDKPQ